MGRGLMVGVIFCAGLNSVSYLVRSDNFDHLFEQDASGGGAIGFPMEMWNHQRDYASGSMDFRAFGVNALFAIAVGIVVAVIAVSLAPKLNRWVDEYEAEAESSLNRRATTTQTTAQFSISGLLGTTALAAIAFGAMTQWAGTRELLWFVYALGPISLIAIAFLPRNVGWQARCIVLVIAAVGVIGGTIWSGHLRGLEFDRTLMGIFIFWTPQSSFAAVGLMTILFAAKLRGEAINTNQNDRKSHDG